MSHTGRAQLLVASNRGPLTIHAGPDGDDEVSRGGGGLVSGMQSALAATPDAVWVCAALNGRERAIARQTAGHISELRIVDEALQGDFDVHMLPIDAATFRGAYDGIANSTLWFVLHQLYDLSQAPAFDASWRRQWAAYVRYNEAFAHALAREAAPGAAVMVQDYHLFLVPAMLRELRPDLRIGHFTHTPWVTPEYFSTLPDDICVALVEGLAAADVIGLHTERWVELFRATARHVLGRELETVHAFPLGTDSGEMTKLAGRRDVVNASRVLDGVVGDALVIGRVDRTELSKNVVRGLLAYRELLRTRPEWRGRVVHAVYDNPSREDLPAYREYTASIERLASAIDDEFATDDWSPVLVEIVDDYPAALAALLRSDVVLINSVRDGMNLVVLEALTISDRSPAIVLSRETGAAEVLGDDALLVNPFDVSATAHALHDALLMELDERVARAERMRAAAVRLPPTEWFQAQLAALPPG
ncbi:trehalose-6-phosphate synthase [Jatrophihabitans sp.]|uniref:alpha,alpha-trehalose-phosphate synthase (UDP-forming) n=1 Tax=Jatrophihabitans sp. TaxID=1932789 RepID=UPI0030C71846|nr:trehalose-6-phosphate synthase [Jatrophihabitans sp.]